MFFVTRQEKGFSIAVEGNTLGLTLGSDTMVDMSFPGFLGLVTSYLADNNHPEAVVFLAELYRTAWNEGLSDFEDAQELVDEIRDILEEATGVEW